MNYYLSTFLSGKNEEYIIKNDSNKVLYQFCCYPNISSFPEPNMGDLILSFLKKLNHFPIHIHVLSHGYKSNLSDYIETKKINNNNFNSFYTVGLIQNLKQLEEFFPISYLDSSNGGTVLITSKKEGTTD